MQIWCFDIYCMHMLKVLSISTKENKQIFLKHKMLIFKFPPFKRQVTGFQTITLHNVNAHFPVDLKYAKVLLRTSKIPRRIKDKK